MSELQKLQLTSITPTDDCRDLLLRARGKVEAALKEQGDMIRAKLDGRTFSPTHTVWGKSESGHRIAVEAVKRVRQGWFTDTGGSILFCIRYAGTPLELADGKNAVVVENLCDLPKIINTLINAVRAGELDAQLIKEATDRGRLAWSPDSILRPSS